jgi:AcrR family transcriptional regulator
LRQQNADRPIVLNATVTELCRRAGVSRNALYRYHPDVLHDLRKLQCRALRAARSREASTDERTQNALLNRHISSLVSLVDHYYIAYREASALLARRERELAEVRRSLKSKPALVNS